MPLETLTKRKRRNRIILLVVLDLLWIALLVWRWPR